jgi:hypothetical protein
VRIGKRRISKKLALIVVPVVLVLGVTTGALAATGTFTDIAGNAHEQSIIKMADRGITTGYPDGTFRPDQPVTRGQMMTFLDRATSCTDCHDSSSLIKAKESQLETSLHGSGEAFLEETRAACAGCHGSDQPKARIDAGVLPHAASVVANADAAPMNCRTCHDIHKTYTGADYSLTGAKAPVKMEYTAGTFDKGAGNLCVQCHQIRNAKPAVVTTTSPNTIAVTSARFGTHYGTQAQMLLGEGGLGGVAGSASVHYSLVGDSCVTCHMGTADNHTFTPVVANCTSCHAGLTTLDRNKVQTDVQALLDQAKAALIKAGIMNAADELAVTGTYPETVANAFWNYKVVSYDGSKGIHNPTYAKALLNSIINTLK